MVRVSNTRMHDIVMSFIPKKNGGGNTIGAAPAPIFKGSVPTLKPQTPGGGSLTKPSGGSVRFEQPAQPKASPTIVEKVGAAAIHQQPKAKQTVVEKVDSIPKKSPAPQQPIPNNTKEPVEKNDSLETIAEENIKISKKKKHISAAKTLIENLIDQKLKKSYINNVISKTKNTPSPARNNRSRSSAANIKKYNQHFLSTKMFDVEPKQTEKSFREVVFKIDGKKERRSRRKKSRDGKKKSRDEKHKKNSNIKIKQTTPPNLRNDLEKIIDGVSIART